MSNHPRFCILNCKDSSVEDSCCDNMIYQRLDPSKFIFAKRARREHNRGRVTTTGSSTEMEHHIWKKFPEDLYETVVCRLPIASFFRSRVVCKKWSSMLSSQSFSQQYEQLPQSLPWYYTNTYQNFNSGAMYDPTMEKWHHLTIPTLPTTKGVIPVASAGGLLCFLDRSFQSFYVCNPLTRSFRELPPRLGKVCANIAIGMTLTGTSPSEGYKILWVSLHGEYEIYDSVENSWAIQGTMPLDIRRPLYLNLKTQAVSIGSTLYFMRTVASDGIVSYDMETGIWKEFIIPLPLYVSDHTLVECAGKLMLVGLLKTSPAVCICIWELQKMTLLWKEVDRMPSIWSLQFFRDYTRLSCLGNSGLILLSIRSPLINGLVKYDLARKEWQMIPNCVIPRGRLRHAIAYGTAFHPCLTAVA